MTDREKIREEVERLMNELIQEKKKGFGSDADDACILELQNVLTYIDSLQEESVSDDLEKAAERDVCGVVNNCSAIGMPNDHIPSWVQDAMINEFIHGSQWKEEQFEKNRLEHCNSITNEQAELEQGFIDQHLDKYNRMPTFLDAIEYGMRLQKEQMMKGAILETEVQRDSDGDGVDTPYESWLILANTEISELPESLGLKDGDKVKIVIVKDS